LNTGTLNLTNSFVIRNHAHDGGGISNFGTAIITHSSIIDNSAQNTNGGGIENNGTAPSKPPPLLSIVLPLIVRLPAFEIPPPSKPPLTVIPFNISFPLTATAKIGNTVRTSFNDRSGRILSVDRNITGNAWEDAEFECIRQGIGARVKVDRVGTRVCICLIDRGDQTGHIAGRTEKLGSVYNSKCSQYED